MSSYRPDMKDVKFEADLQAHPLYVEHWEPVRDWIAALRGAGAAADYYALHRELLNRFYYLQQLENECRGHEKQLANSIRSLKAQGAVASRLRPLSEELAGTKLVRQVAAAVRAIYRGLGDAMVWRLLGYRRPVIAALGQGRIVGRLSDEGLHAELDEIQGLWEEHGIFAIHADLTSCLRHGDFMAIESWNPLRVSLGEAKTTREVSSDSRQAKRLKQVTDLVNQGFHPQAASGEPLHFDRPGIEYETNHGQLRDLVARAREKTYAWAEVEPGLAIEVWDESNPGGLPRPGPNRHEEMRSELGWTNDEDVITTSAAHRRLRDRRLDHTFPSLAPLALIPLAVDDAADSIFGRLDFITTLNVSALERSLKAAGITASVARGEHAEHVFMRAERDQAAITVPAFVREQVQIELMQRSTLASAVDWFLADVGRRGTARPNVDLFYENEDLVWEVKG